MTDDDIIYLTPEEYIKMFHTLAANLNSECLKELCSKFWDPDQGIAIYTLDGIQTYRMKRHD